MKNKILSIAFVIILCGCMVCNMMLPDQKVSEAERRPLTQFPAISLERVLSGEWMEDVEDYVNDQFIGRTWLGNVQSWMRLVFLQQKDVNGLFMEDGSIYKLQKMNERSLAHFVSCMINLQTLFTEDNQMAFAVIPDKNYYLDSDAYIRLDYETFYQYLEEHLDLNTIDLRPLLSKEAYYHTDIHWRQEFLLPVADAIADHYGLTLSDVYDNNSYDAFYGAYAGQWGLEIEPDTLIYLTNQTLEDAFVENVEQPEVHTVYDVDRLSGMDSYDVYLSGATPLTTICNPHATSNKELIIFRDSFASSVAPLLVEAYQSITLVDIRYMNPALLGEYLDIHEQDVLFLYSIPVINESFALRK